MQTVPQTASPRDQETPVSRIKPFLVGTSLGAATMFFALQFHVLRTDSGFKVLPRTPQQSLGLTYADIRSWTPERWQDRPELARAILANGSGELISDSVTTALKDSLTENSATLDEFRGFLERTRTRLPGKKSETTIVKTEKPVIDSPTQEQRAIPFNAVTPRPLPGGKTPADPFRRVAPAQNNSRFTDTDVQQGLSGHKPNETPPATPATPANSPRSSESPAAALLRQQAEEIEKRIFGDLSSETTPAPRPQLPPQTSTLPVFEEVTASLEEHAQSLLDHAQQVRLANAPESNDSTTADAQPSAFEKVATSAAQALTEFVRNPGFPAADTAETSSTLSQPAAAVDTTPKQPQPTTPPFDFDPFLE